jgi:hypothetical protein
VATLNERTNGQWIRRPHATRIDEQRTLRLGEQVDPEALDARGERRIPLCASVAGLGLHAATTVPAHDRERLERLLRYAARPPLCHERLSVRDDERLIYRLRRRCRVSCMSHTLLLAAPCRSGLRARALLHPRLTSAPRSRASRPAQS